MATFKVEQNALGVAMPKLKEGSNGKRVQGGHAPVAYRQRTTTWVTANTWAREPIHAWSRETIWDFA
jgi:hypothetical protein